MTDGESLIRKMATAEQVQQMIDLMKAQMEQVTKLQTENAELRNAMRDANEGGHASQTYKVKTLTDLS